MILDNNGPQSIHRTIDNRAMLMYSAGHEPRAMKQLGYGTLECRTYKRACREAFMFDDVVPSEGVPRCRYFVRQR